MLRFTLALLAGLLAIALAPCANAFSACISDPEPVHSISSQIMELNVEATSLHSETKACVIFSRGLLYHFEGQYERASADYRRAMEWMHYFPTAYEMIGDAYEDLGQHEKAIAAYAEAAKHPEQTSEGLNNQCWARAVRGRPLDKALADCDEALRRDAENVYAYDSRCLVHYRRGEYASAVSDCTAAVQKATSFGVGRRQTDLAGAYYIRGLAKRRSGDTSGGSTDLATAKDFDRQVGDVYTLWGVKE